MAPQPVNLLDVLDSLGEAGRDEGRVTVGALLRASGRRSFGTLLLVPALVLLSPISAIPGIPTTMGVLVVLTAGQLLLRRQEFWLPRWILCRPVPRHRLQQGIGLLRPLARVVDRLLKPRLLWLTEGWRIHVLASICLLLATGTTPLELVPGANTTIGAALTAFALAMLARDGVLAVIGVSFCAGLAALVGWIVF